MYVRWWFGVSELVLIYPLVSVRGIVLAVPLRIWREAVDRAFANLNCGRCAAFGQCRSR